MLKRWCRVGDRVCWRGAKTAAVKKEGGSKYTDTVLLPRTAFPQWLNPSRTLERDRRIINSCGFDELYSWQRDNAKGSEFVLHDGPPYANGLPHMGHAINKVLKDIIMREKLLKGHKIHFKPGWDCHGLPIELRALAGTNSSTLSPVQIRNRARKFAERTVQDQMNIFKQWGLLADWHEGCYHTFDKDYVKNQLQQFWNLYDKGFVYRDLKPVYWSPSSQTALAEAELVYNEKHQSDTVVLRYRLTLTPPALSSHLPNPGSPVYLLIWTTTPWTLPANQAVAYSPKLQYSLVRTSSGHLYIMASDTLTVWRSKLNDPLNVLATFSGRELEGCKYSGWGDKVLPVVSGDHVSGTAGTGLVHTAPAHGHDDFLLAKVHGLPVECFVDRAGQYSSEADPRLVGLPVLSSNRTIVEMLSHDIVHSETITHSYPYDWRTDCPVVIKASRQWFFDTDSIKDRALEALYEVDIIPGGGTGLTSKIEKRPYWCISRQRVWGVPIPVLYHDDKPIVNKRLVDHYCHLIDTKGTDFWWTEPVESLLPQEIADSCNVDPAQVTVGGDILDIWFDSGLSWSGVLEGRTADLYLEGLDQFTGWFQSSLLTSIALQDKAPYKRIFVHGFAVDEEGKKMSKSLGNVVNPLDITQGRFNRPNERSTASGVDLLRWWVGAHSHHTSVPVSYSTMDNSKEAIGKLRNVSKFMLGSLSDYPLDRPMPKLRVLDSYVLHSLIDFQQQVEDHYESYQFNRVCTTIINYVTNQLSAFYLHLIKDRLYCEEADSMSRRAAQFVIYHQLQGVLRSIAPILPLLAEEIYSYHPHNVDKRNYFMSDSVNLDVDSLASKYKVLPVIDQALAVKSAVVQASPLNCTSWQLACTIHSSPCVHRVLRVLQRDEESDLSELTELLQLSKVKLVEDESIDSFKVEVRVAGKLCDRCRRYTSEKEHTVCDRCQSVLDKLNRVEEHNLV